MPGVRGHGVRGPKWRRLCSRAQRPAVRKREATSHRRRPALPAAARTTGLAMLAYSSSRSTASDSHDVPAQPSLPPRSAAMGIARVYIHRSCRTLRSVVLLAEQPCAPHSETPRCQISNLRRCARSPSLLLWASEAVSILSILRARGCNWENLSRVLFPPLGRRPRPPLCRRPKIYRACLAAPSTTGLGRQSRQSRSCRALRLSPLCKAAKVVGGECPP